MAECYLIGIGGTGAKCVEAFVHLCAAGLGPERLWVALVDQDQANGNVSRATQLIESYTKLRGRLKTQGGHYVPSSVPFLRTEISTAPAGIVWRPLPEQGETMKRLFHRDILNRDVQDLMDCLYRRDEEQSLELDEGFRGRPSIGAATILSRAIGEHPFWQSMLKALDSAQKGKDVRVFLIGSLIGGMGASGIPTLGRTIRAELKKRHGRDTFAREGTTTTIGASVLLPYFTFPSPKESNENGIVADSAAFLHQAQGALGYYHRLLERDAFFDQLYLIGWSPLIPLGYFRRGGPNQTNPPLLPELFSALAAWDFYSSPAGAKPRVMRAGRKDADTVDWSDLPEPTGAARSGFGQLVRFGLAYRYAYCEHLMPDNWRRVSSESWFRRLLNSASVNLNDNATSLLARDIGQYADDVLTWLASLTYASSGSSLKVNLIDAPIFSRSNDDPSNSAVLHDRGHSLPRTRFGNVVPGVDASSLAHVFQELTYGRIEADTSGLGRFVGTLYRSCSLQ